MRTLPQLAVSAKLLCLLMVVICGAVPSMVRSVRLYNDCSSSDVRVDASGRVLADDDKTNDRFTNLTIRSVDFGVKLTIFAEEAKRYLCFNRNWKLVGSKRLKGPMCQFYEDMVDNGYNRYRSAANESFFVGFNRKGRPLRAADLVNRPGLDKTPRRHNARGSRSRAKCLNFLKRGSDFSIGKHNDRMGGNRNPSFLPPGAAGGHDGILQGALFANSPRGGVALGGGGMADLLVGGVYGGVEASRAGGRREQRLGKEGNPRRRHGGKGRRKWDGS